MMMIMIITILIIVNSENTIAHFTTRGHLFFKISRFISNVA